MKKILAPVDFGDTTASVVAYATQLARALDTSVELIHTQQSSGDPGERELEAAATRAIERRLAGLVESNAALADTGTVPISVRAVASRSRDYTTDGILAAAAHADLIVMGQTESRGMWRFMVGDTTGAVIDRAPCPVLMVPAATAFALPYGVEFVLGGHLPDAAGLAPLKWLARELAFRLTVQQIVYPAGDTGREALEAELGALCAEYTVNQDRTRLPKYLERRFSNFSADWLCVYHERRTAFAKGLLADAAQRIAAIAPVPTLVLVDASERPAERVGR